MCLELYQVITILFCLILTLNLNKLLKMSSSSDEPTDSLVQNQTINEGDFHENQFDKDYENSDEVQIVQPEQLQLQFQNNSSLSETQQKISKQKGIIVDSSQAIQLSVDEIDISQNQPNQKVTHIITNYNDKQMLKTISKICKIVSRFYSRIFKANLTTYCLHSLKQQQREAMKNTEIKIKTLKQQNWPFKELYYKKNRNQNEQIMFEFVSMCAQKIQAVFKSYIIRKRHKQALQRVSNFKTKLSAVVQGWKCWNIYNCNKIRQIRQTSTSIDNEINKTIESVALDKHMKSKKIQYLNNNQEKVKQNFVAFYEQFSQTGAWIFEVEKCFKKPPPRQIRHTNSYRQNSVIRQPVYNKEQEDIMIMSTSNARKQYSQVNNPTEQVHKSQRKKRKRQFGENRKAQIKVEQSYSSPLEQRPIVAKGQYKLDLQDIQNAQNQFLKQQQTQKDQNNQVQQESKINKGKEEKKKLNKKPKYDPRKAIQQQKKRKLQQQKQQKQKGIEKEQKIIKKKPKIQQKLSEEQHPKNEEHQNEQQEPKVKERKSYLKRKKDPKKSLSPFSKDERDKTVQKVKKQNKLSKGDDNSKSLKAINNHKRVSSKVDCWGNKKEKDSSFIQKQKNFTSDQEVSYKSKFLMGLKDKKPMRQQRSQQQMQHNLSESQLNYRKRVNIKNNQHQFQKQNFQEQQFHSKYAQIKRKQINQNQVLQEQQAYKSNYLKKLVNLKDRNSFSNLGAEKSNQRQQNAVYKRQNNQIEIQNLQKYEKLSKNIKQLTQNRSSLSNLQQYRQPAPKKKEEVYRPIQSLCDVYSSQYTDRLNNLKGKLNMLESTRYIQRQDSVPVLLQKSLYVNKMYKDGVFSAQYWPHVRTMQTSFLDFIQFNI